MKKLSEQLLHEAQSRESERKNSSFGVAIIRQARTAAALHQHELIRFTCERHAGTQHFCVSYGDKENQP